MPDVLELFGRRVRELRTDRGWTQEQLAEAADLHENYISRLETGDQEPGLFVILKLCQAFEIAPAKLLNDFSVAALQEIRLT